MANAQISCYHSHHTNIQAFYRHSESDKESNFHGIVHAHYMKKVITLSRRKKGEGI